MTQPDNTLSQLVAARLRIDEAIKKLDMMHNYNLDDSDPLSSSALRQWAGEVGRSLADSPTKTADDVIRLARAVSERYKFLNDIRVHKGVEWNDYEGDIDIYLMQQYEALPPETRAYLEKWEG